jgi:DNA (cytosine-5)-methyltransferase 1
MRKIVRHIDLFCGIGGFRLAVETAAERRGLEARCVFSCDIDRHCARAYEANFGDVPVGDITAVEAGSVPDHELLVAGFPCQPFSIIGRREGFEDARGTLFFDIARIVAEKRPEALILENVKTLKGHNGGKTLGRILGALSELGYKTDWRTLNALDFGLPQKRERIWIVAMRDGGKMEWPQGGARMTPLSELLEKDPPEKFFASERIRKKRLAGGAMKSSEPTIWHENKSGNVSAHPYSCALRAGASHNYLLVDGERRLTPREMLRLQGFPDDYRIVCGDSQTRRQAGNSLPVNVAESVAGALFDSLGWSRGRCSDS